MTRRPALARYEAVDVVTLLVHHSLTLLPADAGGVLLTDDGGQLRVLAASDEDVHFLELLELDDDGGPAQLAFATHRPVAVPDLASMADRWPIFVAEAGRRGFRSAHAFPLGAREETIGSLVLFSRTETDLDADQTRIAEGLASMSSIAIINRRAVDVQDELTRQLQRALETRLVIEQAKGIVAAQRHISLGAAFERLRSAARASGRPLSELAADVVEGRLPSR